MTRFALILVATVAVAAPLRNVRGDEPKPEQIVDKAIQAHGGEERLNGLSGFSLKDHVVYEKGPIWNYEIDAAPPTRYRSEIKSGPEDKNSSVVVIDGDHGWSRRGDQVEVYPPTFLDFMRKNTIPYAGPRSVLRLRARLKNPKCQFSTVGECTVNGHQAIGLRMKLEGGPQQTWFFDKESGLLLKMESRTATFEGDETVTVMTFEDYQKYYGFPLARRETTERDGKLASTRELTEFRATTPSEGAFAKP
jgi:hypothetical protein